MLRKRVIAVSLLSFLVIAPMGPAGAAQDYDTLSWPRQLDGELGQIVIYQPQFEDYSGNMLKARAAVSVTPQGETEPAFGAIWFDARLATDTGARTVSLESIVITNSRFPDSTKDEVRFLSEYLEEEIPKWEMTMSMDRLVAGMETIGGKAGDTAGLNNDPPKIIYASEPTVLITIDGEPILEDLEGADLKYVVNTPFYVLQDPDTDRYYLRGGGRWYTASDIRGEWQVASSLPRKVSAVADEIELEERSRSDESAGDAGYADPIVELAGAVAPRIIVSTTPAEVIETDGRPAFAPIEGTDLLYLQNSESDIIMDIGSQRYFILLAGRWYTSDSLTASTWTHVSPNGLPADFYRIPLDSEMAGVRASVAGTDEAADAVAENMIPQTAEVDRHTASVTVTYDGAPEFEWCTDDVAYAVNTDKAVLFVDDTYYCCDDAVWFVSDYAEGPWAVATKVPREVRDLPPSCPVYNVTYVYIYDVTPDIVYVGYTPAYLGSYVYRGCVVYGTGHRYRPWHRRHYYPRHATWGYGAHWRPHTGWGFYFGVSFGWLDVWFGRPWYTGWWGPCGYVYGYRHGYDYAYYSGYHDGYSDGYHDGYWDSSYAGYYPGHSPNGHTHNERNLFTRRARGIRRDGTEHRRLAYDGDKLKSVPKRDGLSIPSLQTKQVAGTPVAPPRKNEASRGVAQPWSPVDGTTAVRTPKNDTKAGSVTQREVKRPKTAQRANDVYADPDGRVYRKSKGQWEKVDRGTRSSPQPSRPAKPTRNVLDKDDKARRRGDELEKKKAKAKPKSQPKPSENSQPERSGSTRTERTEKRPAPGSSARPTGR